MLFRPGSSGAVSACKLLYAGNAYRSICSTRKSNFTSEILSCAGSSTSLRVKMTATKSTWSPNFVPLRDAGATATDPKCLLRVVSYNILAQIVFQQFCQDNGKRGPCMTAYVKSANFPHSPRSCLRWKNRSEAVVSRLLALDADLLCLQELDEYHSFYKEILDKAGYGSVYVQRGNRKKDGCGILFKRTRVTLLSEEVIDYNVLVPPSPPGEEEVEQKEIGIEVDGGSGDSDDDAAQRIGDLNDVRVRLKRDCVGIIAAFKPLEAPDHVFVLANTHIFWDPVLMDVKLAQVHHLASSVVDFKQKVAKECGTDPLVIFAGDFNSLPGDAVYNYLVSGTDPCEPVNDMDKDRDFHKDKVEKLSVDTQETKAGEVKEWLVEIDRSSKFPLPAVSLYAYADCEPAFTNYTHNFVGTLDYMLFVPCDRLKPRTLLALPKLGALEVIGGLPNHHHPSDHLPIGCEFALY